MKPQFFLFLEFDLIREYIINRYRKQTLLYYSSTFSTRTQSLSFLLLPLEPHGIAAHAVQHGAHGRHPLLVLRPARSLKVQRDCAAHNAKALGGVGLLLPVLI
jgi:hypothetical protein